MGKEGMTSVSKNEELDWSGIEVVRSEVKEIFTSINTYIDQAQAITEIGKDRGFEASSEMQKKSREILNKFAPYGEYQKPLRQMISDLMSIGSMAFQEGLLIKAEELNAKLAEIKSRSTTSE